MPKTESVRPEPHHILHVLHTFVPDTHGGVETYVARIAAAQQRAGHRITVLAGRERGAAEPLWTEQVVDGLRVLRLRPRARDLQNVLRNPDLDAEVFGELLRREGVDLVHLHHWHNVSSELVRMTRAVGVPVVVTAHDFFSICPRLFRMRDGRICAPDVSRDTCVECVAPMVEAPREVVDATLVDWYAAHTAEMRAADPILTLSRDQADYLQQVPQLRGIEFRPVDLPTVELSPSTTYAGRDGGRLRIVTWGGLVPGKGLDVLVRACERLDNPHEISVHHFGRVIDESYATAVRGLAQRIELEIAGTYGERVMREDFPRYDLAVFPSLFRETYGYVVDEAMLLGLPVVISDLGAPPERLGQRGVAFTAGDAEALAEILQRLIDEPGALAALRDAPPGDLRSLEDHCAELAEIYRTTQLA